ncbi:MAG: hypothetical protein CL780_05770 [Chloroflexi bacterium]|nr:hypothetical protein [Chloroflexota bacterium]
MKDFEEVIFKLSNWNFKRISKIPEGSNYVFLVQLEPNLKKNKTDEELYAVYKPLSGEKPLMDFPIGSLHNREKFSWIISLKLGWPKLPPLVIRNGPYGIGSLQLFIESHPKKNYFTERKSRLKDFMKIAAFDVLINNSDRKAGSCLIDLNSSQIWAIDHGLTFNYFANIRTVMFEFIGQEYSDQIIDDISSLIFLLENDQSFFLNATMYVNELELKLLIKRGKNMLREGLFPSLDPYVNVPWPLV